MFFKVDTCAESVYSDSRKTSRYKMPRETKAERVAREAAESVNIRENKKADYTRRLMAMLSRAAPANYEIEVRDNQFHVVNRDDRYNQFVLTIEYSDKNSFTLDTMDWTINSKEESQREAERRRQARLDALNKLTDEERKLLNI